MKRLGKKLKSLKVTIRIALCSFIFISCNKENKSGSFGTVETAPISSVFFSSPYTAGISVRNTQNYSWELGTSFSVTKNGRILSLGAKMPWNGTFRVALWDTSEHNSPLAQATITQTASGQLTFSPITPVPVYTGKGYIASVWVSDTTDVYVIVEGTGNHVSFPIISGSVTLTGAAVSVTTSASPPTYPVPSNTSPVGGLADIEFQPEK